MHFRASIGGREWHIWGASARPAGAIGMWFVGLYSVGEGATFSRLGHVVCCPSLGARLNPVFMHGLSQIECMSGPSIEQGIIVPGGLHPSDPDPPAGAA